MDSKVIQTEREEIPAGFAPTKAFSGCGKLLGPYYLFQGKSVDADGITHLGLLLDERHGGGPGRGHGGVTMTLLDEAMGRSASVAFGSLCVTMSMNTHFCSSSMLGDFLIARARVLRKGRNTVFVEGTVHAGGKLLSSASGIWMNSGEPIPGNMANPRPDE